MTEEMNKLREKRMRFYEATMKMLRSKYPCRGCKYYTACGEPDRTQKCDGRKRLVKRKLVVRKRSGVVRHLTEM